MPLTKKLRLDDVIYWVRSIGPDGKDRVPMFYKGRCDRSDEGQRGFDIKGRPVELGPGEYTATYGGSDFEYEDGTPV
jgi:hypothetical protein